VSGGLKSSPNFWPTLYLTTCISSVHYDDSQSSHFWKHCDRRRFLLLCFGFTLLVEILCIKMWIQNIHTTRKEPLPPSTLFPLRRLVQSDDKGQCNGIHGQLRSTILESLLGGRGALVFPRSLERGTVASGTVNYHAKTYLVFRAKIQLLFRRRLDIRADMFCTPIVSQQVSVGVQG